LAASRVDTLSNHLLSLLDKKALQALESSSERVELKIGERLSQSNKTISHAYFPVEGMISLVQTFADGATVEVGLVGKEGFWGTPLVLGVTTSPIEAMVQAEGWALRVPAATLKLACDAHESLRGLFLRYAAFLHVQAAITAACNGRHKVAHRLARWLLEADDRVAKDELPLSHEFLSFMLGVRRAGVTDALKILNDKGLIQTGRNRIKIRDRPAIESAACECYALVKSEYRRLFRSKNPR